MGDSSRASKVSQLFENLDRDGDGYLNAAELLHFVRRVGFKGDSENWADEFDHLCDEFGLSDQGFQEDDFSTLLEDPGSDYRCDNKAIEDVLEFFEAAGNKRPAKEDIEKASHGGSDCYIEVFRYFDKDADGFLNLVETMNLATSLNRPISQDTASQWWEDFCDEWSCNPDRGIDGTVFVDIAKESGDNPLFIEDAVTFVNGLKQEPNEPREQAQSPETEKEEMHAAERAAEEKSAAEKAAEDKLAAENAAAEAAARKEAAARLAAQLEEQEKIAAERRANEREAARVEEDRLAAERRAAQEKRQYRLWYGQRVVKSQLCRILPLLGQDELDKAWEALDVAPVPDEPRGWYCTMSTPSQASMHARLSELAAFLRESKENFAQARENHSTELAELRQECKLWKGESERLSRMVEDMKKQGPQMSQSGSYPVHRMSRTAHRFA